MRTTVIPALKNALFYVPFISGGAVIANQLAKIPGVSEQLSGLEQKLSSPEKFALGLGLAWATSWLVKKSVRRRDFKSLISPVEHQPSDSNKPFARKAGHYFGKLAVKAGLATASAALLLSSSKTFASLYDNFAGEFSDYISSKGKLLEDLCSNPASKVVGGLLAVGAGSKIYSFLTHRKHPPIMKEYHIHDYIPPHRWVNLRRIFVQRPLGIEMKEVRGMHSATVFCAKIISTDYATGQKLERIMAYRGDVEPRRERRKVSAEDIGSVFDYLRKYLDTQGVKEIAPSEVMAVARKSGVYDVAKKGALADNLGVFDVSRIVSELSEVEGENVFSVDTEDLARKISTERVWALDRFFQVGIYDNEKSLDPRLILRESQVQTVAVSRDHRAGYGENFARRGKLLMVLSYQATGSGRMRSEAEFLRSEEIPAQTDEIGTTSSVLREFRMGWNERILSDGLGKSYQIHFGNHKYYYNEWWTGSGKFITDLIPGLRGKEYAIRRIGYVYDEDGKIVAKITDSPYMVLAKLIGKSNKKVYVYDGELAKNENFGALLCGFSRFLGRQRIYRDNRLQNITLEGALATGTGDADYIGQV